MKKKEVLKSMKFNQLSNNAALQIKGGSDDDPPKKKGRRSGTITVLDTDME